MSSTPTGFRSSYKLDQVNYFSSIESALDKPMMFLATGLCKGDTLELMVVATEPCENPIASSIIRCGCRMGINHENNIIFTPFPGRFMLLYNKYKSKGVKIHRMSMNFGYDSLMLQDNTRCCVLCADDDENTQSTTFIATT